MKFNIENDFCTAQASEISTLKAGGALKKVYYPSSTADLIELSNYIKEREENYIIIGKLSNTLVLDGGYDGITISAKKIRGIEIDDNFISAGSGESLLKIINTACNNKLSGLEKLLGIPASVGGAVCMNCGSFGQEISNTVYKVYAFDIITQKTIELTRTQLDFAYRSSLISQGDKVVIGVSFKLKEKNTYDIKNTMKSVIDIRKNTQPKQSSLGSVFKRVGNSSAAIFIEGAGLKGYRINGMQVSKKHANFIINTGAGSADDYLDLVEHIEEKIHQRYGIRLEREVRIVGKRAEHTRSS